LKTFCDPQRSGPAPVFTLPHLSGSGITVFDINLIMGQFDYQNASRAENKKTLKELRTALWTKAVNWVSGI
jgi:hypothetical protein